MNVLGIYCAGGFGGVVYYLAKEINNQEKRWEDIFFIDDAAGITNAHTKVISYAEFSEEYSPNSAEIVIAAGEPRTREFLFDKVKKDDYILANLIHPMAHAKVIDKVGEGNIICNFAYVSESGVELGNNNILMPYAQVRHNNMVGNHCVIASSVNLSGTTVLRDRCYIGVGAKLRECITIGEDAIVGMGAVVTKSVDACSVVMGMPAREVRKNSGKVFRG